jgi:hypothetical protein
MKSPGASRRERQTETPTWERRSERRAAVLDALLAACGSEEYWKWTKSTFETILARKSTFEAILNNIASTVEKSDDEHKYVYYAKAIDTAFRSVSEIASDTTQQNVLIKLIDDYARFEVLGFDESKTPGYTDEGREDRQSEAVPPPGIMPDEEHDLNALRAQLDIPFDVARKALEQAQAELTARGTTARATAEPRPVRLGDAAREATSSKSGGEVAWPAEKWKGSPEELSRKQFAIFVFLRRVWKPFIEETGALVTRQMLMERDRDAGLALKGALRGRRPMPSDIRIVPTRDLKKTLLVTGQVIHAPAHI